MSEYQLELKQIVDYPRCRIYRQFIGLLMKDKSIRVGGTSGLYHSRCCPALQTSVLPINGSMESATRSIPANGSAV